MLICIDPGHGGRDPGAVSVCGKYIEKDNTLQIARSIHGREIQLPGVQFMYTRLDDVRLGDNANDDLLARAQKANEVEADLFISIHQNADTNRQGKGVEVYHYPGSVEGERLAQAVQEQVVRLTCLRDRGIKTANFFVLRETNMPAILVEAGFVSGHPEEAEFVSQEGTLVKIAEGILLGVADYLGIEYGIKQGPFPDVPPLHPSAYAVQWCKDNGLVGGYPDGSFRGNEPVTRYQMVHILHRLAHINK